MPSLGNVILMGTEASMPTASIPGRTYYTTDTLQIFRDNGSGWDNVTPGADLTGSANQILATPNGASGTASLRALAPADLPVATTSAVGAVQPDGTSITITGGVISAVGGGGGGGLAPIFGNGNPYGPGVVQATTGGGYSLAFASNVASGSLLIVSYKSEGNVTASTCSDSVGTTYTKVASITGVSNNLVVFAGLAGGSGTNTVTIGSPGNSYDRLGLMQVSGVGATVDATQTDYAGSSPTTVAITTTTASDFLFAAVGGYHSNNSFTFDSAWTLDSQSGGSDANAVGHELAGVAGSYPLTVTVTAGSPDNQPIILVAFKSTASPVSGTEGQVYYDTSLGTVYTGYVYHSGAWAKIQ